MKPILIFALLLSISLTTFCQDLSGVWKGNYRILQSLDYASKITLKFSRRKNNNEYVVKSYTPATDSGNNPITIICHVLYKRISEDSIYLAEDYVLSPNNPFMDNSCRQKMFLKLFTKKGKMILSGIWKTYFDNCNWKGTIKFIKQ